MARTERGEGICAHRSSASDSAARNLQGDDDPRAYDKERSPRRSPSPRRRRRGRGRRADRGYVNGQRSRDGDVSNARASLARPRADRRSHADDASASPRASSEGCRQGAPGTSGHRRGVATRTYLTDVTLRPVAGGRCHPDCEESPAGRRIIPRGARACDWAVYAPFGRFTTVVGKRLPKRESASLCLCPFSLFLLSTRSRLPTLLRLSLSLSCSPGNARRFRATRVRSSRRRRRRRRASRRVRPAGNGGHQTPHLRPFRGFDPSLSAPRDYRSPR